MRIQQQNGYAPIVLDSSYEIVDGYHRTFALKELGCNMVWAYVPDQNSQTGMTEF